MQYFLFWSLIGFVAAIPYASFFEWLLHRFVMHKAVGKFDYAFRAHALIHHKHFKADHTYHLVQEEHKATIPMAWWNGPVLVFMCVTPFLITSVILGNWAIAIGAFISFSCYYGAYEYIHWCMHLPKKRQLEMSWIFRRLNGHHLLHHRYMQKNFNVVFPLADLLLGTLMLRSPVHFAQARGPSVPDVQPRTPRPEPAHA